MNEWFYVQDGAQKGPISEKELQEKLDATELALDTRIWQEGMTDWIEASTRHEVLAVAEESEHKSISNESSTSNDTPSVKPYFMLSVVACIFFLFNPFAAFALVFALQAKNALGDHRYDDAARKITLCKRMLWIALILSIIIYTLAGGVMTGIIPMG